MKENSRAKKQEAKGAGDDTANADPMQCIVIDNMPPMPSRYVCIFDLMSKWMFESSKTNFFIGKRDI